MATPSGKAIKLPDNVSEISFVSRYPDKVPLGAVTKFKTSDGKEYVALYQFAQNLFVGYGQVVDSQAETSIDNIALDDNGELIFWESSTPQGNYGIAGIPYSCYTHIKRVDNLESNPTTDNAYGALKPNSHYNTHNLPTLAILSDQEACFIPPALHAEFQALIENADMLIYNPYGRGGLLINYKYSSQASTFIYLGFDLEGNEQYFQWVGTGWIDWQPLPWEQITFGDVIAEIIGICRYLLIENPHQFLDGLGMTPTPIGIAADGINALWYLVKGDLTNAGISAISMVPFIGDVTGYTLRMAVKAGQSYQSLRLVGQGAEAVLLAGRRFQNYNARLVDEALIALGQAINKYSDHIPALTKLSANIAGPAELRAVLRQLDDMPAAQRELFLADILRVDNSVPTNQLLTNNLDKVDVKLVEAWKKMDNFGADEALRRNHGALEALSKKTAGQDPPFPNTYLSSEYIQKHLAQFDEGASYLVPKDILERFGNDLLGWPDNAQFIMPKAQMDNLLSKTGNDIKNICIELGINPSDWLGRNLVRIDIPDPKSLNIRMARGSEMGANNNWIPGGNTSGGRPEAVIDNIPKGKYIEIDL